jgi:hypothetical protein
MVMVGGGIFSSRGLRAMIGQPLSILDGTVCVKQQFPVQWCIKLL